MQGSLVHDHDMRLQECLRLWLPTVSEVWDGFHHGVSHGNQY